MPPFFSILAAALNTVIAGFWLVMLTLFVELEAPWYVSTLVILLALGALASAALFASRAVQ